MDDQQIEVILTDYIRHNLSPTAKERRTISERYEELQRILEGNTFQTGSYARFTSTTPVNDLDVIYVLPESVHKSLAEARVDLEQLDISNIITTLADALREAYPQSVTIKVQPHSVGIFFGSEDEFSIDVVPAIPLKDGMYMVPEVAHLSVAKRRKLYESLPGLTWIRSDPKGYIKQARSIDEKCKGRFRKASKFVKKWKGGCKSENSTFALKSFHAEILVTELSKRDFGRSVWATVVGFFEELHQHVHEPELPDRADSSRYIDEYLNDLTEAERNLILKSQEEARGNLNEISDAESEVQVLKGIEKLLKTPQSRRASAVAGTTSVDKAYSKPYHL